MSEEPFFVKLVASFINPIILFLFYKFVRYSQNSYKKHLEKMKKEHPSLGGIADFQMTFHKISTMVFNVFVNKYVFTVFAIIYLYVIWFGKGDV